MIKFILLISVFSFSSLLCITSCDSKKSPLQWAEYCQWLSDQDNGLTKNQIISDKKISVQLLPTEYSAYREIQQSGLQLSDFDSLKKHYEKGLLFMMEISNEKDQPIIYDGITNMQEYSDRVHQLSFRMQEYLSLKFDDSTLRPVLAHTQRLNELGGPISILAVFPKPYENDSLPVHDTLDLVYEDPFWGLGINHFLFQRKDLQAIPQLAINHTIGS